MKLSERVSRLREQSLNTEEYISSERAELITQYYSTHMVPEDSVPEQRARAFEYILLNKKLVVNEGELIVGERGPGIKATPTYPELSLHSLEDLDILDSREKVSFRVDEKTREIYRDIIIPFWKGRSNRERIMKTMTTEWLDAYRAGIFTEFQEQRGPGHTVLGRKLYTTGLLGLIKEAEEAIKGLDPDVDTMAAEKGQELRAMIIAAEAMIAYAERYALLLGEMALKEEGKRKDELLKMQQVCRKVPANAPETVHELLQHYWFLHLGVITELNPWDSFNPGRLDQHLYPVWKKEKEDGRIGDNDLYELLGCFWIKFNNHPAPPKVGITALESNTYTDFCLINIGGLTPEGEDGVNEMSYILLDVIGSMRLLQPSSMIQVSHLNPDSFIHKTLDIIKTGFGQPSIFNTDAIIEEMLRMGKDIIDARNGGASGCVETGAFGTEAYWLSGYFNLPKVLELTLNNGFDKRTGKQIGPETGSIAQFKSFDSLIKAFSVQLNHFIDIKIKGNNAIENIFAENLPVPFLSLLIEDCISNGVDYNAGGARYNTTYIQGVGLGTITDMLSSIRYNIYDRGRYTWDQLIAAMESDFVGHEDIQFSLVYETPKYGNDDDYADKNALTVFELFYDAVNGRETPRGAKHRINLLPTTSHVYFGSVLGTSPDGRKKGLPLSEGISPYQGADSNGPTAVIKSASKIDHLRTGGTLLNQKFSPQFFEDEGSYAIITALIRSYFSMHGHHIQFNVVSAETLKAAQKNPELYRDLIVRVAGYSDYFNDLGEDLQNEIIRRTEHGKE